MKKATVEGSIRYKNEIVDDLTQAIINEDIEKIELNIRILQNNIIKLGLVEALNTALLTAFNQKQSKIIEYLILRGAEINAKEDDSISTPVFKAAENGDLIWFKEILNDLSQETKVILIDSRNENEETPLFSIVKHDKLNDRQKAEFIEFFIKEGAELNIVNRQHQVLSDLIKALNPNMSSPEKNETTEIIPLTGTNYEHVACAGQSEKTHNDELMFYLEQ